MCLLNVGAGCAMPRSAEVRLGKNDRGKTMLEPDNLRYTKIALNNGSGAIPALGFGTLIPDPIPTRHATRAALEAGFRQLDASERYRNEKEVGEAMREVFQAGKIKRVEVFVATTL